MIPHVSRLLELWRIAAHYRLDTLFPAEELPEKARHALSLIRMHPAAWSSRERKNPLKLKLALEEMGPLAIKLGQLLSTRRDLIAPEVLQQLVLLQDIQRIMQQAEPDLAAHLSPWIGPSLAHELGKIQRVPQHLKRSLQSHLFFAEDALKEDLAVFAPRWQMDDLNQDTRILNQNLDRAEAKIQQLQAHIDAAATSASPQD